MNWVLLWRERSEPKLKTTIHFRLSSAALPRKRPEPDVPSVRTQATKLPTHPPREATAESSLAARQTNDSWGVKPYGEAGSKLDNPRKGRGTTLQSPEMIQLNEQGILASFTPSFTPMLCKNKL